MNRGYIKFWRKAQDSSSWNRGLMYQGLMINLLSRAAWKKDSYQGRDILPGQFGAVMSRFSETLGISRTTLQRMLSRLKDDKFLKIENAGNRFIIITIVNWSAYQTSEFEPWATDGQPTVNQRAADGQPSYKEEELKKEEVKNTLAGSLSGKEGGAREQNEPQGECSVFPDISDSPGIEFRELRRFYDEHGRAEAPLTGFIEYKQLRASRRWPGMSRIRDAIDAHARADPVGWKKFAPGLVKFLREHWWEKKSKARASPSNPQEILTRNMETTAAVLAARQQRRQGHEPDRACRVRV